jgi:signal transduction histidine kinase
MGALSQNPVSELLRVRKHEVIVAWEAEVARELPELHKLSRAALIDHLPEYLDGLASWVEGDTAGARGPFEAMVVGHAIQRIGYGIDLRTLTREYILLREVLARELERLPLTEDLRVPMQRLTSGMDEAMMEAVRKYTEQRDQARDRFIAILAHDLRTPVNAIAMAGSALALALPAQQQAQLADVVARSSERIARMVDELLELARTQQAGGIPVKLTPEDMAELHARVVEELRVSNPARDLKLTCHGELRGMFDRERVSQALSNLVGNAIQHGRDPVEVVVRETEDRRTIETRVTSQGDVIPADVLHTLFDPLVQSQRTRSEGLGLGLYIASQIALAHGATCDVASTVNEGTTFVIRWPRARRDELGADPRAIPR